MACFALYSNEKYIIAALGTNTNDLSVYLFYIFSLDAIIPHLPGEGC